MPNEATARRHLQLPGSRESSTVNMSERADGGDDHQHALAVLRAKRARARTGWRTCAPKIAPTVLAAYTEPTSRPGSWSLLARWRPARAGSSCPTESRPAAPPTARGSGRSGTSTSGRRQRRVHRPVRAAPSSANTPPTPVPPPAAAGTMPSALRGFFTFFAERGASAAADARAR